jgi:hypothetical protein
MSRTSTATPPPPFFPARNTTPTMRHSTAPNVTSAHFGTRHPHNAFNGKRKTKALPTTFNGLKAGYGSLPGGKVPTKTSAAERSLVRSDSFEEVQALSPKALGTTTVRPSYERNPSADSITSIASQDSVRTTQSDTPHYTPHESLRAGTPTPSMSSTTTSTSSPTTPIATPATSLASLSQTEDISLSLGVSMDGSEPTPQRASWVLPNFGKMAKAVIAFGDRKSKSRDVVVAPAPVADMPVVPDSLPASRIEEARYAPTGYSAKPSAEVYKGLDENQIMEFKREWAVIESRRITDYARLCSQWPQSGYNITKWGPNGMSIESMGGAGALLMVVYRFKTLLRTAVLC